MLRWCLAIAAASGCSRNDDIPAPTVAAIVPARAAPGTTVMIEGDAFCAQPEGNEDPLACAQVGSVQFGLVPGAVGTYTDVLITVEVPAVTPGTLDVTVAVAGRRSNSVRFTVDPP